MLSTRKREGWVGRVIPAKEWAHHALAAIALVLGTLGSSILVPPLNCHLELVP